VIFKQGSNKEQAKTKIWKNFWDAKQKFCRKGKNQREVIENKK